MASSIWHTDGEVWVPKYQIYFGGVMNTPAYVVFEKKKGLIVSSCKAQEKKKKKNYVIVKQKNHVDTLMDPT